MITSDIINSAVEQNATIIIKGSDKEAIKLLKSEIKNLMQEPFEVASMLYDGAKIQGNDVYFIYVDESCVKKIDLLSDIMRDKNPLYKNQ